MHGSLFVMLWAVGQAGLPLASVEGPRLLQSVAGAVKLQDFLSEKELERGCPLCPHCDLSKGPFSLKASGELRLPDIHPGEAEGPSVLPTPLLTYTPALY